ncbi:MAG TPA: histidine kinase [Candidatus Spyradocola merdavium]|nr:histidine kinase [Candidatus Spyradocola merdavium]
MRRISLRTMLLVMMVAVTLCTMLLFNAVYGNMTGEVFSQLDLRLINQNLARAKDRLDEVLLGAQDLWDYVQDSVLLREDFAPGGFSAAVEPLLDVEEDLSSILLYKRTGTAVAASDQSEGFLSSQNPQEEAWFQAALAGEGCAFSGARLEHCYRGRYTWVVTLAGPCVYRVPGGYEQGILAVNLRLSALADICDAFSGGEAGTFTLADSAGQTVYSPHAKAQNLRAVSAVYAGVGARSADERQIEISQPLEGGQYVLTCRMAESQLAASRQDMQRRGLLVLGLSLLLALTMAFALSAYVARPFRAMERTMAGAGAGFPGPRLRLAGCKEFAQLSNAYNAMIDQIERLMRETKDNQDQLRQMEIAALEEQINPHFLYNALDSITWLIETQRGADAVQMVGALAKLLRLSINRGGNFHAVRREVEHVESYLLIQRTRYGQRFSSRIHVERAAEDLLCPRLILQPLVENAIKHGIGDNTGCTIEVRVFLEGESLVMTVRDDGMGILPDKLRSVQQALRESQPPHPDEISGLALKSVNRRIRLLCGAEWGITIDSETEEYTCVRIALPVRRSA